MKVFVIAAVSADGFIGENTNHLSTDWTSKEDKKFFTFITKEAGVVVMGSTTFYTFKRKLADRRLIIYTSHPENIDVDGVETTSETPAELIKRLHCQNVETLAVCGGSVINKLFMDNGLVDEVYLTVEPVFFGKGIPVFAGEVQSELSLLETRKLNDNTVLIHYAVNK